MKNFFGRIIESIRRTDKKEVLKWSLLIGGGGLTLFAGWVDQKIKDQKYEKALNKEIQDQARKLLSGGDRN